MKLTEDQIAEADRNIASLARVRKSVGEIADILSRKDAITPLPREWVLDRAKRHIESANKAAREANAVLRSAIRSTVARHASDPSFKFIADSLAKSTKLRIRF